jgi:hypothetical protein
MGFFKEGKSMKYKNKDGIELSYKGNDMHQVLVREVIEEAIKVLEGYNRFDSRSAEWALSRGVNFLKDNFDLWEDDYPYNTEFGDGRTKEEMEAIDNRNESGWRIKQFNRNRSKEDQASTIEELENKIKNL